MKVIGLEGPVVPSEKVLGSLVNVDQANQLRPGSALSSLHSMLDGQRRTRMRG